MATLVKIIKQLEKTFAPVEKQFIWTEKIIEPLALKIVRDCEMLKETITHQSFRFGLLERLLSPTFFEFVRFLKESEESIKDIELSWDINHENITRALLFLAGRGWFFPIFNVQIITLINFYELAQSGDLDEPDRQMDSFFENNFDHIKKYLFEKYPHRRHLLYSGMKAHKAEEYELAILLFFSQVDGFCWDDTKCIYFKKKKSKPEIGAKVQIEPHRKFAGSMLSGLTNSFPVAYNERERNSVEEFYSGPNRHTVMHGEDLDYGTKENSLKALSLLYYIALALEFVGMGN